MFEDSANEKSIICNSTPKLITIETSSACNLKCVMCSSRIFPSREHRFLPLKYIEKIQPLLSKAEIVDLHGNGEPLISPSFWTILDSLQTASTKARINTNLNIPDIEKIKRIAHSNLSLVNISIDAATSSTYKKIRGNSFSRLLTNIETLVAERNKLKKRTPEYI